MAINSECPLCGALVSGDECDCSSEVRWENFHLTLCIESLQADGRVRRGWHFVNRGSHPDLSSGINGRYNNYGVPEGLLSETLRENLSGRLERLNWCGLSGLPLHGLDWRELILLQAGDDSDQNRTIIKSTNIITGKVTGHYDSNDD